jgi:hypothetical protein
LAPILLVDVSARLRHYRPQGRKLLLVLKLLMLKTRLERSRGLVLDRLMGLRVRVLLLARLLLYVLILEST